MRKGSANSGLGATRLVAEALKTSRAAGASGLVIVRADSAFYGREVIAAIGRAGARFSITVRADPAVGRAIAAIADNAWTTIRYPNAIWDEQLQQWVSDAEVAEVPFTAFTSRPLGQQVSARLIVRRVRDANPNTFTPTPKASCLRPGATTRCSPTHRCRCSAEADHRRHAIIEQVIADLKNSALAHLPSGSFAANSAWLALATIAFNLTRAAGCLASRWHAKATTATIRRQLINVPARTVRSARRLRLRLPANWPWQADWLDLLAAAARAPTGRAT